MTLAILERDTLMPRPPRGMGRGLLLALLVHGALVIAIAFSVRWRASEPEGVEAELWAAVPQIAAPRAVEPQPKPQPVAKPEPPAPPKPAAKPEPQPDAQIAIEKAKREEAQRKKKEEAEALVERRKLDEAQKRRQQEDKRKKLDEQRRQAAVEAQRNEHLKRIMGQAAATGGATSTGNAERTAGPSAGYAGRIKARIKPNIVFADTPAGNPVAEVELRLAPDGTILSHKLTKSSGLPEWDEAVQRAVVRTQELPRDVDGSVPSSMVIAFRPRD